MEAAIALISEKGFKNTTAAEIGERAGYSRSMVQFRYGTKEALLATLLREEWEPRFLVSPDPSLSGLEQLLAQLELVREQVVADPATMRGFCVLSFEALGPLTVMRGWLSAWLLRYEGATAQAIGRGIADGSVRPSLDPAQEAGAVVSEYVGLAFRWLALADHFSFVTELDALRARLTERYATSSTH
jgi:AcrR family transcriptional regulator